MANLMTYEQWIETLGKYRWYLANGSPRVYFEMNGNWKEVYDIACKSADISLGYRQIDDPIEFTHEFFALVPSAWTKYRIMLEMATGMFDGKGTDPDIFYQTFVRVIDGWDTSDVSSKLEYDFKNNISGTEENTTILGDREDTTHSKEESDSETKNRSIQYIQGVQAQNTIGNDNIGELGRDFASGFVDTVEFNNTKTERDTIDNIGEQINNSETEFDTISDGAGDTTQKTDIFNKQGSKISDTRFTMYDNIAFLRMRMEFIDKIKPFSDFFKHLFNNVSGIQGFWNYNF